MQQQFLFVIRLSDPVGLSANWALTQSQTAPLHTNL